MGPSMVEKRCMQ